MPYNTSYYRNKFYRRGAKFYKRKTANLSRYNTYKNRSSAAQANQIYNLARRINRIQRLNKPEIKLAHANFVEDLTFEDSIAQNTYSLLQNGSTAFASLINGKFARLNSLTLTMSFRYDNAALTEIPETGYSQRLPQPIYLRMLFVQFKASRQSNPDYADLFDTTNGFTRTRGPLRDGAARVVKILSDKKFMVNFNHQTINRVIRFNYLRNFYAPPSETLAKGDVRLYIQCWNPNAVNYDGTNVILTMNSKTAYTDA